MLESIRANFACDKCGRKFSVPLSTPMPVPAGWTPFMLAEDAIRSGHDYKSEDVSGFVSGSVSDDSQHYCHQCTEEIDQKWQKKRAKQKRLAADRNSA